MGPPALTPPLYDSNVLIDFLNGVQAAVALLDRFDGDRAVSIVTWIEVMAGPAEGEAAARLILGRFRVLQVTNEIAVAAAVFRRERQALEIPDAVILATARVSGRLLVTRNIKDFSPDEPGVVVPYRL